MKKLLLVGIIGIGAAACGGAAQVAPAAPVSNTTTTNAQVEATPKAEAEPAKPETQPELVIPESAPAKAEPCEARTWWSCVTVALDSKKVDKRETLLLGDPTVEETSSGKTDSKRTFEFKTSSGETLSVALRRLPGNKSVIVLKSGKGETIIDRHDADDYQYVSVIAAEKAGKAYIDVRYMR